jgi:hypothetical protein
MDFSSLIDIAAAYAPIASAIFSFCTFVVTWRR